MRSILERCDYAVDPLTDVWMKNGFKGIEYNDGDESEMRIGSIVASAMDLSVLSPELRKHCTDWVSLYHLSSARANILRPFEAWLSGEILELGAGCGAITRFVGECGGRVLALEGSARRAAIARSRSRDLRNVTVLAESFRDLKCDHRFDVVTLIGVLEYANVFTSGPDPMLSMLVQARSLLKPNGKLIIAIENQLGLKYFAGALEDHLGKAMYGIEGRYRPNEPQTVGHEVLARLLRSAGFATSEWLVPLPDYKLPVSILTSRGLGDDGFDAAAFAWQSVRRDPQLPGLCAFSLELAWPNVFVNQLALGLANSFLVVASPDEQQLIERDVLAYHYSTERKPEFCKQGVFRRDAGGAVRVEYNRLVRQCNDLGDNSIVKFVCPESDCYSLGKPLSLEFVRIVTRDGWSVDEVAQFIRHYLDLLQVVAWDQGVQVDLRSPYSVLPGAFFDVVPQNLILDQSDRPALIDREWELNSPIELGHLLFRALLLSLGSITRFGCTCCNQSMTRGQFVDSVLEASHFALTAADFDRYVEIEQSISRQVAGDSVQALLHLWRDHPLQMLDLSQAVGARDAEILRLNTAYATQMEGVAAQVSEIHRLHAVLLTKDEALTTQVEEIHRLHAVLLTKDEALTTQVEEIRCLNDAVGSKEQGLAAQAAEIHRLHAVLLAKEEALVTQIEEIRRLNDAVRSKDQGLAAQAAELLRLNAVVTDRDVEIERRSAEVGRLASAVTDMESAVARASLLAQQSNSELAALRGTKWFRLRDAVVGGPWSIRRLARVAYLLAAIATPRPLRVMAGPTIARLRARSRMFDARCEPKQAGSAAYAVRSPQRIAARRVRVVHVIANFMTGGSSRLVVDLIENLSHLYEQFVVTSFIPSPPAYTGLEIVEFRPREDDGIFGEYFSRIAPAFVHVHYWGDCDEPWYAKAILAAEKLGIPIVENINTPVAPYRSPSIRRYVYVSEYVRQKFGQLSQSDMTIYPGSDFSHFDRPRLEPLPDDCVGMVYRLEADKLNARAIDPFIRIVQKRPVTKALIVGGGSLLTPFREAVAAAGVADRFEFTGYVSYESLPAYYRRMSLFIAPVWKESFGQVSLFAMNMRIPVIGYDVGAIGEIVDDPELLAPPADAEGLASIAIRLLDSPSLRKDIGARQRARAQAHFSLEAMNAAYARLYDEMTRLDTKAIR